MKRLIKKIKNRFRRGKEKRYLERLHQQLEKQKVEYRYKYTFKILLLEIGHSGMDYLTKNYLTEIFHPDASLTIGVGFYDKKLVIDQELCKLQIWVISSEERHKFLVPKYSEGTSGAIIFINSLDQRTMSKLKEMVMDIRNKFFTLYWDIPIFLVFNKSTEEKSRGLEIYHQTLDNIFDIDINGYIEVSINSKQDVENLFFSITQSIKDHIEIN